MTAAASLVFEDHLSGKTFIEGLRGRGLAAIPVADLDLGGRRLDTQLVRDIDSALSDPWVLVTQDLTMVSDAQGFDWSRYAIAWVLINENLRGAAQEQSKQNIVHRHATPRMVGQRAGDHWSYTEHKCEKHPPNLVKRR